jgi:hypothetical protein
MKKELYIFIGLFLFLSIGMHFKQWTSHPIDHLIAMPHGGAFGVPGIVHPFVFTLVVYLIVGLFRLILGRFSK